MVVGIGLVDLPNIFFWGGAVAPLGPPEFRHYCCRMGEFFECVLFTTSLARVGSLPHPVRKLISGAQNFTSNDDIIFLQLYKLTESDRALFNIHVQKVDIGFHPEAMTSRNQGHPFSFLQCFSLLQFCLYSVTERLYGLLNKVFDFMRFEIVSLIPNKLIKEGFSGIFQ